MNVRRSISLSFSATAKAQKQQISKLRKEIAGLERLHADGKEGKYLSISIF